MKHLRTVLLALGLAASVAAPATAQGYYTVNGQFPSADVQMYMASNGLPPGHYWLTPEGYWGVMGNWTPLGNIYGGQGGGGGNGGGGGGGAWSQYTPNPTGPGGFGVGGTGDGCIYTTSGWSNC